MSSDRWDTGQIAYSIYKRPFVHHILTGQAANAT
ncbi:hypothetical protein AZE42_11370 [Rhizopogon vesiculosus]|uniref:Uncharacterized protein n=1 Tax=Rhizopogon vesiculosus TaxID=180088 RepID=A0A1J8PM86_9AGAM|nr:hypothetical protein AZE42_11370 [Rhizopogon vesiculosus]